MIDPIERQTAINIAKSTDYRGLTVEDVKKVTNEVVKRLEKLPSAEKRGKWERHWSRPGVYADLYWHCTACGGKTDMQWAHIYFKYCPYCGATMERGTDE